MSSDELPLIDRLAEDYLGQIRAGDKPSVQSFVDANPQLEEEIRELFPTLAFIEQFKPHPDENASGKVEPERAAPALEQIGDYRILKEIGRGGMGVVYEAEQLSLGRRVALKVLPNHAGSDQVARERFQREARATARLQHPNIVPIIDVGSDGAVHYYAMHFVHGQPLNLVQESVRQLRSGGRVATAGRGNGPADMASSLWRGGTPREGSSTAGGGRHYHRSVAHIGVQIADALTYSHEQGVIHRDVKPSNLLLDGGGKVWVTDFGLAKTVDDNLTLTGDIVGTLRFIAPERFAGQCDARADVFSVGATLYELLVLQPAFHSPDRLHLIERITKEDPRPLRSIDPGIPIDLETIVLKALEKDPRRRYRSAAALREDLHRFLVHQPILARRTSLLGLGRRWAARNRALAVSVLCLALLVTATVVGSVIAAVEMRNLAGAAEQALTTVERQLYCSQMNSASLALADGRVRRARELLEASPQQLRGWEWHHLFSRLDRSIGSPLPADMRISRVDYGADGRYAIVRETVGNDYVTSVMKVATGQIIMSRTEPGLTAGFDRSGRRLMLRHTEFEIWDLASLRQLHRMPCQRHGQLRAFDFGRFGYGVGTEDGIEVRDWQSHRVRGRIDGPVWDADLSERDEVLAVILAQRIALVDPITLQELPGGIDLPDAGHIMRCEFVAGQPLLVALTAAGVLPVFRLESGRLVREFDLRGYSGAATCMHVTADGKRVAVATNGGRVHVWNLDSGEAEHEFSARGLPITSIATNPGTGELVVCDSAGNHWGWWPGAAALDELQGHTSYVYPVTFSPDGSLIASGGWDGFRGQPGALRLWDAATGRQLAAHRDIGERVMTAAFVAAGERLVVGLAGTHGHNRTLVLDVVTGAELLEFDGHGQQTTVAAAGHPDGRRVLSISNWGTACLWDLDTGAVDHSWVVAADGVSGAACAVSPDGRWVALPHRATGVQICDADSGERRLSIAAHAGVVTSLAFGQGGRQLISTSMDDTVAVWDTASGTLLARLVGHGDDVLCAKLSPDGTRIASGGRDGRVLLWDTERFQLVARLVGHRDYIYSLDWNPADGRLVTGSGDGTVRLWGRRPLVERVRAWRQREQVRGTVSRRVAELLAQYGDLRAAAARVADDPRLSPYERQLGRQVLIERAAR